MGEYVITIVGPNYVHEAKIALLLLAVLCLLLAYIVYQETKQTGPKIVRRRQGPLTHRKRPAP